MRFYQLVVIALVAAVLGGCSAQNTRAAKNEVKREREVAVLNVQLASGYIQRGSLEIAKAKLLKALEYDDEYVPAYTTLAVLQNMLGEVEAAKTSYLNALDIDKNDPDLRNNYGAFLCEQGKYEEAKNQFMLAINNQFYETPEAAYSNLGYCLMQGDQPDYKTAEHYLRRALAKNQNISSALLAMGELGIKSGKYLMSRAYMQRYHSIQQPTSHSLWIQIQAEYALGDKEHFLKISRVLLKQFPESKEAEKVMRMSRR